MSHDLVPEEEEQEYTRLLTMLRSAAKGRVPIPAAEQAQITARVRERLAKATSTTTLPGVGTLAPQQQFVPHPARRRAFSPARFAAFALVALVVIGLLFGSWALFRAYSLSPKTPASTVVSLSGSATPTLLQTQAQANGLESSMRVLVGGPYFLGELLPIDVSFTNHTQKQAELDGSVRIENNSTTNACFPPWLLVQVTGGSNLSYTVPQLDFACTQPYIVSKVPPGQTITIHEYVPLTKSNAVTLATGILPPGYQGNPLDKQWPTVHIQVQVNSQIPQNRSLSLQSSPGQVTINVPAGAKPHLLYMQSVTCGGYSAGNSTQWTPLATTVLHEPACPTAPRHWTYIVSAPGYSIVSGSQTG